MYTYTTDFDQETDTHRICIYRVGCTYPKYILHFDPNELGANIANELAQIMLNTVQEIKELYEPETT